VVDGLLAHGDDALSHKEERRVGAKLGMAELRPREPRPSSTCRALGGAAPEEGGARVVTALARHGQAAALVEASCAGGRAGWERAASRGDWARGARRDPGAVRRTEEGGGKQGKLVVVVEPPRS